jgi:quinol monooxygenase YgiN
MIAILDARPGRAGQLREVVAFEEHLQAQHVHDFIAAVPALSTAEPASRAQLRSRR